MEGSANGEDDDDMTQLELEVPTEQFVAQMQHYERVHQIQQQEEEMSKLRCAMDMTRMCEQQRCVHFKGHTGFGGAIHCCAYTAPTMAISVMFLDHTGITSTAQLNDRLTRQLIQSPDCTPLTQLALTNGINEVVGHIWSHHRWYGTGIDAWIVDHPMHHLFEAVLHPGVNMLSFYDPAQNQTVHHSFVYVSRTDPAVCFVIDSWGAATACRDLVMRQLATADVIAALLQINTSADPSEIMERIFLDPVAGGSCHSRLHVVTLKPAVMRELVDTQFKVGCRGSSLYGGGKRTKRRNPHRRTKRTKRRNARRAKKANAM